MYYLLTPYVSLYILGAYHPQCNAFYVSVLINAKPALHSPESSRLQSKESLRMSNLSE